VGPSLVAVCAALTALPAPAAADESLPFQASLAVLWLPAGRVHSGASGEHSSYPAHNAYGVLPAIERRLSQHLTLGLTAPVLLGVKPDGFMQKSVTELELLVRLAGWWQPAPRLRLFAFFAPGGFIIFVPASVKPLRAPTPKGIVAALGGGAAWWLSERWFLLGQLGVHQGLLIGHLESAVYSQFTAYIHLGLGAGATF
jgi:hypothetical protein